MSSSLPQDSRPTVRWLGLVGWFLLCFVAPALGYAANSGSWYSTLNKPAWNPAAWLFGPVWTFLYATMAVAAWLVWCRGGWREQRRPLILFVVQLALNALWTPLFFGLHRPDLAFVEIVLLWVAIVATIHDFAHVRSAAAWLLAPYLAWVSFASVLNFTIWQLNT
jgi:tryptophan-rich sensory protein